MGDRVLSALSQYGSPALFLAVMVAAIGIPLPVTLLLVVTGSLVSQGVMNFWWAIGVASAGSIVGDQIGYAIGRWGGTRLISKCIALLGGPERFAQAEATARRWGGWGVFFSRWLVSPLGPWINFASGIAAYSWVRFVIWDILGEVLGVAFFIALGRTFSDRIQALAQYEYWVISCGR